MGANPESVSRQGYRFRIGIPADLRQGEEKIPCDAQNLSRSGVLLIGSFQATPGETLEFSLKAPSGTLSVEVSGRVTRVSPTPEGDGVMAGLEFLDMDEARRDALEVLLARMLETPSTSPFDALKPGCPPQEIRRTLEAIALPQRIALATRATAKEREYLRQDTNPAVLEALVRNPGLAVAEARLIAASTHLIASTLDALAQDSRFKDDEDVRFAIATHPRVIMTTAEKVTAELKAPQLKKLLAKPGLNQILKEKLIRRSTQR
jgi:hypothetical protein